MLCAWASSTSSAGRSCFLCARRCARLWGGADTVSVVWWEKLMVNESGLRIAEKYTVQSRVFPGCIRESACGLTFQFQKDLPKEVAFC